ncbi:unnamed protein product [Chrysoparadoxa australica]
MEGLASFAECDFGLDTRLLKACSKLGYVCPTLVQSKCLPLALSGKDLLVRARTGSGKTAAYALPLLHKILQAREANPNVPAGVKAVILVPTRELCQQVRHQLLEMMAYCRGTIDLVALTDDNISAQKAKLRDKPDVIVATPTKLVAHLKAGNVSLKDTVESLVVDEADLLLSFGYSDDIRAITACLPKICQGFLMSATLSPELEELKRVVLHSPVILKLEEGEMDGKLVQFYVPLQGKEDKDLVLFSFLKLGLLEGKGLFFVNSTDACYRLKLFLELFHIRSAVLNAELPLNSRLHILQEFNRGIFDYLIATDESMDTGAGGIEEESDSDESESESERDESQDEDGDEEMEASTSNKRERKEKEKGTVQLGKRKAAEDGSRNNGYGVARGIDFHGVQFVMNVDVPLTGSAYTHRIGRTARGGASGTALSLVAMNDPQQVELLEAIQSSQPPLPALGGRSLISSMGAAEGQGGGTGSGTRPQPAPLDFDIREVEQFRYRVEDTAKKITRVLVKEARVAEMKAEMLNSEKLEGYFKENPNDLKVLRHDKSVLKPLRRQDHLAHIPDYLIPAGMQTGQDPTTRQRKRRRRAGQKWQSGAGLDQTRRKDNDPLQSFDASGLGSQPKVVVSTDGEEPPPERKKVFQSQEYIGRSTAGRQRWQERHKKGRFKNAGRGNKNGTRGRGVPRVGNRGGRGNKKRQGTTF